MDSYKLYQYTHGFNPRAGDHPAAVEMRAIYAEVAKLAERFDPLQKAYDDAERTMAKELKYRFTFDPIDRTKSYRPKDEPEDTVTFTVTATAEGEIFDQYKELFGSIPKFFNIHSGSKEEKTSSVQSVTYLRKNGVIAHCTGGHIVLEEYSVCTDEEWAEIKKGNVDKKFYTKWMLDRSI